MLIAATHQQKRDAMQKLSRICIDDVCTTVIMQLYNICKNIWQIFLLCSAYVVLREICFANSDIVLMSFENTTSVIIKWWIWMWKEGLRGKNKYKVKY